MSKTIKVFVFTHNDKPNEFTLGLSSGYIDERGHITNQQKGAEDTFAIGMPVYDDEDNFVGHLSIGLFENLNWSDRTSDGQEMPVYYWKVDGYKGKRQGIKTYYQYLATHQESESKQ